RHAQHLFVVRSLDGRRDALVAALQARGVGAGIHYPIAIHQQEWFRPLLATRPRLPVTERLSSEVLSLPLCADLTDAEADMVADQLVAAIGAAPVGSGTSR